MAWEAVMRGSHGGAHGRRSLEALMGGSDARLLWEALIRRSCEALVEGLVGCQEGEALIESSQGRLAGGSLEKLSSEAQGHKGPKATTVTRMATPRGRIPVNVNIFYTPQATVTRLATRRGRIPATRIQKTTVTRMATSRARILLTVDAVDKRGKHEDPRATKVTSMAAPRSCIPVSDC